MYDEKENAQEITLLDMVNSLIKKWKIIVWVTLAALILGAVAGLGMALIANRNYGTRVEFFVSSDKANNQLLSVLKSDKYAEALLMDENGLPGEFKNTEEYAAAKALLEQEESLEKLRTTDDIDILILWMGDKLSNIRAIYRDFLVEGNDIWNKFHQSDIKVQAWYYRSVMKYTERLSHTLAWNEYKSIVEKIFGVED